MYYDSFLSAHRVRDERGDMEGFEMRRMKAQVSCEAQSTDANLPSFGPLSQHTVHTGTGPI
jgi:hypothetical protein